ADTTACQRLPMVLTLFPGPKGPRDLVKVEVIASRSGIAVIDDAATFNFTDGKSERLDFVLYGSCLASSCATEDPTQSCDADGTCKVLNPTPLDGEPALDAG